MSKFLFPLKKTLGDLRKSLDGVDTWSSSKKLFPIWWWAYPDEGTPSPTVFITDTQSER